MDGDEKSFFVFFIVVRNCSFETNMKTFFEKQLQSEFFESKFDHQHESRIFASSSLSDKSIEIIKNRITKLADELNDLHLEDAKLPINQKNGHEYVVNAKTLGNKSIQGIKT